MPPGDTLTGWRDVLQQERTAHVSRFKRLTDTEARTLTRRELLDRIEAEQAY